MQNKTTNHWSSVGQPRLLPRRGHGIRLLLGYDRQDSNKGAHKTLALKSQPGNCYHRQYLYLQYMQQHACCSASVLKRTSRDCSEPGWRFSIGDRVQARHSVLLLLLPRVCAPRCWHSQNCCLRWQHHTHSVPAHQQLNIAQETADVLILHMYSRTHQARTGCELQRRP